ncbi:helix-turn-helix domain-containing protein [Paenibacillus sp. IITD108]|uniref:helix-turn-helix domain-containing protein n=1 Tax=Paenibacillus sp. IITD108 TaxID=3116649 RepID=UPI002F3E6EDD
MSDLGALLRKAREERKLSLDDIQELTKIRKRYLEAIESGDHSVLPGTFYVRAFIKNYSEAVGLNPEEVLRLYQHEVPPSPSQQEHPEPIAARPPRRVKSIKSERFGKIGFNIVMWCFFILIIVVVWYYAISRQADDPDKLDPSKVTTQVSQRPSPSGAAGGAVTPTPSPTPTPTPTPTTTIVNNGYSSSVKGEKYLIGPANKTHTIEVKINGGKAWVEISEYGKNGNRLYYDNAQDGAVLTYELPMRTYVNVGRADYAEIKIDGVLVTDGDKSSSKKFLFEIEAGEAETGGSVQSAPPSGTTN